MMMNYLVSNKHLQLQLSLIQFLSVVLAFETGGSSNGIVDMAENSTQSTSRNQIAGKRETTFAVDFPFKLECEIFHSIIASTSNLLPLN